MKNSYETLPLNGRNTFTSESSIISANDEGGTVDPWLDRFVTALIVILICCFIVMTTSGSLEAEQSTSDIEYRPFCKVPTSRYSQNVRVVQTSLGEPTQKWAPQECIISTKEQGSFEDAYGAPDAVLSVQLDVFAHPNRPPILGFGGAFTEVSALNFRSLSQEGQDTVLQLLFGELGYNLGRVHINSCDFSLKSYAYDTINGDFDLVHFSIDHDVQSGMIDMMKRARDVYATHWNVDNFKLYAAPWSPPAWMKAPTPDDHPNAAHAKTMLNSAQPVCLRDGVGPESKYAKTWALYFSKFLEAYQSQGLDMFAISIQNEPEFPAPWEACSYTKETMADFLANHLGPQLVETFPNTKILIFDHNKDHAPVWIDYILKKEEAAKYVSGTAYHWYAGSTDRLLDGAQGAPNMHRVMAQLNSLSGTSPTTPTADPSTHQHIVLGSEACHCPTTGYAGGDMDVAWTRAERYAHSILADLAAGSQGWVEWNLLLDSMGGPNHLGNLCDASLLAVPHRALNASSPVVDFENGRRPFGPVVGDGRTKEELHALGFPADLLDQGVVAQPLFYYMGHISRYVRPGSRAVPALASSSRRGQTFRTSEGIAGGGQNNLARQGIEVTVWPCEGSTRQQFMWDEGSHQLQVFGHDWLGVPTTSCVGRENNQDFLGVMTGSCNVTDGFAGEFDIRWADDESHSDEDLVKIVVTNANSTESCLMVQELHNAGGAYGPRGGAQVAVGKCDSDAALWTFNSVTGEVSSSVLGDPVCMTTGWPFLQVGAFDTPTRTAISEKVVVVLNEAAQSANYVLKDGATVIMAGSIPPRSIQTILID